MSLNDIEPNDEQGTAIEDDIVEEDLIELPDGTIIVGEPEQYDEADPTLREFDDNLAENYLTDNATLISISQRVLDQFNSDKKSREEWERTYEKGLETMQPENQKPNPSNVQGKLSTVIHPMIAESATEFQARAISELFPAKGPVGTTVLGKVSKVLQDQANRVQTYMNYQLTEEMDEYFPDLDQMLFHLPLVGQTFKKSYFDVNLGRVTSVFIRAKDFVVNAQSTVLSQTVTTEVIRYTRQQYDTYVENGFYLPLEEVQNPDQDLLKTTENTIEGVEPDPSPLVDDDSTSIVLLEQHRWEDIESDSPDELPRPYTVTIEEASGQVVAIRRNWDEEDPKYRKAVWYTGYKFLPGLGFYGYGLYHVIGSLGRAATGALRSLLDSAAFSNLQGGFKLKGALKGGTLEIAPGEFVDISAATDDIKKALMPLPFKEPSQALYALLEFLTGAGKSFANAASTDISEANQNTPVGTTVALLEENARIFSAIHKRLHVSQKHEFKLIAKLNGIYLPDRYPFQVEGGDQYILRRDFDSRVDVVPSSDPSTFSSTQRIAQAEMGLSLAEKYPQYHNVPVALRRMYDATRYPNYEEVLIDPTKVERLDAVAENIAIMHGKPIKAYEDQDHMSHMIVLDNWISRLPPEAQQIHMNGYISHRTEHMALLYRTQVQSLLAAPLPPLPNFSDPNAATPPTSPEDDYAITQAAAVVVNATDKDPIGPPIPEFQPPQPPQGAAGAGADPADSQAAAQAAAQAVMMKAQADIQAKQMKSQADMQMQQAKFQMTMEIEQIQSQAKLKESETRELMKAENDKVALDNELEALWAKTEADIQIAMEKAQASIEIDYAKTEASIDAKDMEHNVDLDIREDNAVLDHHATMQKLSYENAPDQNDGN